MSDTPIRIATRGSPLARAQAEEVAARLRSAHGLPEEMTEVVVFQTSGDRIQDRALAEAGGKGLFTKELEEALLDGRADIAVHSAKDMPTVLPDGLVLTAYLEREDVRDAFLSRVAGSLAELDAGAVVGTASLRRQALVRRLRPDLKVVTFRGNVQTRLRKLEEGEVQATLLALAGLKRLGAEHEATGVLGLDDFPPALGQGAITVETRADDARVIPLIAAIDHAPTAAALTCERAFLAVLDGSCRTPIAGHAVIDGDRLRFRGLVLSPDGTQEFEAIAAGAAGDAEAIGRTAGEDIVARAGTEFLAALKALS
ncbi:hydroxymethylbilane synthase [Microbaculum marinisediminis]|uniref:Porphobilinogen deaminase n=1 Tax=Microbaculum marinisediminis TaxID=2931392 RepID=A0AAW5QZL4_9HYPH|nr:hydroxymethylbilane synthase [Microbaculum sp. A6E488]MCT8972359.1 hydroxymethylbilane synthase [Microbaculum sp. A6E488]